MTAQNTSVRNPIDRLWLAATSDRLLVALLALLALTTVTGLLLPQKPASLAPSTTARWLAETASRYGGMGSLLQELGLFDLWRSPWLWGLLGSLAFVLLLRLANAANDSAGRLPQPDTSLAAAAARRWPLKTTLKIKGSLDPTLHELEDDLRNEGWRVAANVAGADAYLAAERNAWGILAAPLIYAGLVAGLAALWLWQVFGWQEAGLVLLPDRPVALQHAPGANLTLVDSESGPAALVIQAGAALSTTHAFSAGGAVQQGLLRVQRTGEGQALTVRAAALDGAPLQMRSLESQEPVESSLTLVFDQPRAEQTFLLPARQLAFSVVAFPSLPERGFSGPAYLVQALQVGRREPLLNEFVAGDADLTVGEDEIRLQGGQFVTVRASYNPGAPLLILGGLAIAAGLLLAVWRPTGRFFLHLHSQPDETQVTASLKPSLAWPQGGRWLGAWSATYLQAEAAGLAPTPEPG